MKRLLAHSIMLAGLTASSQLLALGLGELTLQSSLNQPLKAEIELVDAKGLTEWDIKAAIAAQAEFDRAGVDRTFFLNGINFTIDKNRILLTTREPVNEPFLNFLVELNWPAGRALREYTVLIDPPVFEEQSYAPLMNSAQGTQVQFISETVPGQPVYVNQWDGPADAGSYKVQQDDTLWEIALKTRPSNNVSPQQMMLAIQQENPNAFIGGNINRLKSHTVLNIPDAERVRAISMGQAVAEVARQNQALKTGVAQVDATGRAGSNASSRNDQNGGEVRLISGASEQANSAAAGGEVAQGSGSGSRDALENELAVALENVDKSRRENEELRTRLESLDEQINTLQRLISLKDDQLASMQVTEPVVSSTEAVGAGEEQDFNYAPASQPTVTPVGVGDVGLPQVQEDAAAEQAASEAATTNTEQEEAEVAARRARIAALLAEEQQKQQQSQFNILEEIKANPILPAAGAGILLLLAFLVLRALKKPKYEDFANEEGGRSRFDSVVGKENNADSFDDFDMDDDEVELRSPVSPKESEYTNQPQHFDTVAQTEDALSESDIYIAYGKFDQAADLLKDAIASEPDRAALRVKLLEVYAEMDDAKAFAKVEGELEALGDAEASKEARAMRQRLSSPLAPIAVAAFAASTAGAAKVIQAKPDAEPIEEDFADLSDDFADGLDFGDALDMADDATTKEAELDSALDLLESDVPMLDSDDLDFGLDDDFTSKPPVAPAPVSAPVLASENDALEFNLDDFGNDESAPVAAPKAELSMDDALDFDMDFGSDAKEAEVPMAEAEEALTLDDDMSLDFDSTPAPAKNSMDDLESLLDANDAVSEELPDLAFDMDDTGFSVESNGDDDLRALERELETAVTPEANAQDDELSFDLDDMATEVADDLAETASEETFDFSDAPVVAASDEAEIDLDALAAADDEFDFLAGTDECATKLDLARAYIDMEDFDGARELLQEVVQEGSDPQKADARALMNNLA